MQEPFGFTSAAEGFVFLGACLAGFVYGKILFRDGWVAMRNRVWKRARLIYAVHISLVLLMGLIALCLSSRLPRWRTISTALSRIH